MGLAAWCDRGGRIPTRPPTDVYRERGYYFTGIGFRSSPVLTHPDDEYVATPGSQTFDRAWQGWQKPNAASMLAVSSNHPGMGPHVPGTDPPESVYGINTMQFTATKTPTTQKVPAMHLGTLGPGVSWAPNPTAPSAAQTPAQVSVWETIRRRIFGG